MLFDLLTFKKELKKVFNAENVEKLKDHTVEKIVFYVNKDILGVEKKQLVVNAAIAFISSKFITKNGIVNFFVQLLIKFMPNIVQYLFDSLKRNVSGLTEKTA